MKKASETKVNKKSSQKKKPKQVSIFLLIAILVIILIIIGGCIIANCIVQSIRYKTYTDQMYYYGYNELYSNERATAYQKVSNIDMIKVILGTINNNTNVEQLTLQKATEEVTENDLWYEYARDMGITTSMTRETLNKRATSIDAVIAGIRALEWVLSVNIEEANLNMTEKALSKFNDTEKSYIAKAVTVGIISNDNSGIEKDKLIKGELNKLVIELANRYATVHYDSYKLDEKGFVVKNDIHIVTDKDKLPETSKEYPYVVSNIEKDIYDLDFIVENKDNFKSPKEVYSERQNQYSRLDEVIEGYYNTLLNIDYKTIDATEFAYYLTAKSVYFIPEDDVNEYIKYVKDNKIILKGKAETLLPIIYYTGDRYVVRTKITFEVISSNTEYNLLYTDQNQRVKYDGKEITMYVDVPMGLTLNSNSLLVDGKCNAVFMVQENEKIHVKGVN